MSSLAPAVEYRAAMPPQLLTIAAELRLRICELALLNTTITTASVGKDIRREEIIISDERQQHDITPSRSISLLLVCKQLNAEVSPIFYDHVRLHLSPWSYNDDWEEIGMGLRYFVLEDLLKAPRGVKRFSIYTVLAEQLTERGTVQALHAMFAKALPHLQELIVYDDLKYDATDEHAKENAIAFVEGLYEDKVFGAWSPLYKLLPTRGHMFTVIQQVPSNVEEVGTDDLH